MITSVALLCASLAWAGWVYLHTVGDVHRAEKVATAVLQDPDASRQLSTAITDQLMGTLALEPSQRPLLRGAVEDALADPRVSTDVIAAFGSAHANAIGVDDPRPTTIDGAALVAAVRSNLSVVAPEVAQLIPDGVVGAITLPKVHPPGVAGARRIAEAGTTALGLLAVALIVLALVFGERRRTVRRVGIWGVTSGLGWMVVPYLVQLAAKAWAPSVSSIVAVAAHESAAAVLPAALALVVGGGIAIVMSFVPSLWPDDQRSAAPATTAARPAYATAPPRQPAAAPARPTSPPPDRVPVDTFQPSGQSAVPPVYGNVVTGQATHPPYQSPPAPPPAPEPEFDPWAHYGPDSSNRPT